MHPPELKERARELRAQGMLVKAIADEIGVPKPTVIRWCNPELEARERSNARERNFSQGKTCALCKKNKTSNHSTLCRSCYRKRGQRVWTRERLIEAVREWVLEHGNPPSYLDWQRSGGEKHPATRSITSPPYPVFKTWSGLIKAAGFTPGERRRRTGRKPLTLKQKQERAELRRQLREEKIKHAVEKGERVEQGGMGNRP